MASIILVLAICLGACSPIASQNSFSEKRFLEAVQNKERLKPITIDPYANPSLIAMSSEKHVDIHEARRMMVVLDYCLKKEPLPEKPLLVISFLDEEGEFVEGGFVSQAVLNKNDLLIYCLNPSEKKLQLIHKEDFDAAFGRAFGYDAIWEPCYTNPNE
jgi:hypothetical protein